MRSGGGWRGSRAHVDLRFHGTALSRGHRIMARKNIPSSRPHNNTTCVCVCVCVYDKHRSKSSTQDMSRIPSEPLQLQPLSLVDKSSRAEPTTPTRKSAHLQFDIIKPSPTTTTTTRGSTLTPSGQDALLYQMAQKKRELQDLQEKVRVVEAELQVLQDDFNRTNTKPKAEPWALRSKKSISNLFQTSSPNRKYNFIQGILDKVNDLAIEEDEFDKTRTKDRYYIRDDEEEESASEHSGESSLGEDEVVRIT